MQVIPGVPGHCDHAWLDRVTEVPVATGLSDLPPPITFDQLEHLANLHIKVRAFKQVLAPGSNTTSSKKRGVSVGDLIHRALRAGIKPVRQTRSGRPRR